MWFFRIVTVLAGLVLVALTGVLGVVRLQPATGSSFIAFVSDREGDPNIYLMSADGSGQQRLIETDSWDDSDLAWSPDGEWIAFSSFTGGAYLIRPDGSDLRFLAPYRGTASPGWSPDGKWMAIAFNGTGNWNIYRISPWKSVAYNEWEVVAASDAEDWEPAWSPDGEWIAFSSNRDGTRKIYRVRPDGSDLERLTNTTSRDDSPIWSPDGEWIIFSSDRDGSWAVYRMRPDGSDLENLSQSLGIYSGRRPSWSPDGAWIAFGTGQQGYSEIYRMRPDGSDVQRLTNNPARDYDPAFSPPINLPWRFWLNGVVGVIFLTVGVRFSVRKGG